MLCESARKLLRKQLWHHNCKSESQSSESELRLISQLELKPRNFWMNLAGISRYVSEHLLGLRVVLAYRVKNGVQALGLPVNGLRVGHIDD